MINETALFILEEMNDYIQDNIDRFYPDGDDDPVSFKKIAEELAAVNPEIDINDPAALEWLGDMLTILRFMGEGLLESLAEEEEEEEDLF